MGNPQIKFVESHTPSGPSGGIRDATLFEFSVNEKKITVEVHGTAMRTRDGQMELDEIKVAAEAFLNLEAQRHGWDGVSDYLVLDDAAMDFVIGHMGWSPRFGQKVER